MCFGVTTPVFIAIRIRSPLWLGILIDRGLCRSAKSSSSVERLRPSQARPRRGRASSMHEFALKGRQAREASASIGATPPLIAQRRHSQNYPGYLCIHLLIFAMSPQLLLRILASAPIYEKKVSS
jgi:hypothetical protein